MRKFEKISINQFNIDFSQTGVEYDSIKLPKRATAYSSGYDIYSPLSFKLGPGEIIEFPTGIRVLMPHDEFLAVIPRSGQGFKFFLRLANTVGNIDADYANAPNEGHVWVKLRNESTDSELVVKAGDAIAQGIFMPYLITDDDDATDVRVGGLGSTSKSSTPA